MSKTAFDGLSRYSGFQGDPSEFVIAGLDTDETFPANPLVDDESNASPVDEGLVAAMMVQGFIGSVVVTKMGGRPYVVDGRRSVRAAREASRRRIEAGGSALVVHADKVDAAVGARDLDLYGMVVSRNEHRREKTPMERAKQAQQMTRYGADVKRVAALLGVTESAVRGWLDLTTLAPAVQAAVSAGKVPASKARKLRNLPEKDQNEVVSTMLAESSKAAAKESFERASKEKGSTAPVRPGKKDVKKEMARYEVSEDFRRGVLFALGEVGPETAFQGFALAPEPPAVVSPKCGRSRKVEAPDLGFDGSDVPE